MGWTSPPSPFAVSRTHNQSERSDEELTAASRFACQGVNIDQYASHTFASDQANHSSIATTYAEVGDRLELSQATAITIKRQIASRWDPVH